MLVFYDFEVFRNDWMVVCIEDNDQETIITNDQPRLVEFYNKHINDIWVGYNTRHYDRYILKGLILGLNPYKISKWIIEGNQGWEFSRSFYKVKLYDFDIKTTMHSLKELEAFMGFNIQETTVDFDLDRSLTQDEINETIKYCRHDVQQTMQVFLQRKEEFESHIKLIKMFDLDIGNVSKTKAQISAVILDAQRAERNDEFNLTFPPTLKLDKYSEVLEWYKNPENHNYESKLELEVDSVNHIFGWGGVHGAIPNYCGSGIYLNMDVASLYPALMLNYNFLSRNVKNPEKYRNIRDERLRLKQLKDPNQAPLKIVLNGTYGASKAKFNSLYDPLSANNVCVAGQLLLLDLIEKLEGIGCLIQTNTDGIIYKVNQLSDIDVIKSIAKEWEIRTGLDLEYSTHVKIIQKDVNNYIIINEDGSYKSKGAYVKKLHLLDNDLPIVNKALVNYFVKNIPVEDTISECKDLIMFQKVKKISYKYAYGMYGDQKLSEKCLRVFASVNVDDPGVFKIKIEDGVEHKAKIENTPEHCYIDNSDVRERQIDDRLDINWYINIANERIKDFFGIYY